MYNSDTYQKVILYLEGFGKKKCSLKGRVALDFLPPVFRPRLDPSHKINFSNNDFAFADYLNSKVFSQDLIPDGMKIKLS